MQSCGWVGGKVHAQPPLVVGVALLQHLFPDALARLDARSHNACAALALCSARREKALRSGDHPTRRSSCLTLTLPATASGDPDRFHTQPRLAQSSLSRTGPKAQPSRATPNPIALFGDLGEECRLYSGLGRRPETRGIQTALPNPWRWPGRSWQ
eukprot:726329-Amphidinium_carterae.1